MSEQLTNSIQSNSPKQSFLLYKPHFIEEAFETKTISEDLLTPGLKAIFKEKIGEEHPFDYNIVEGVVKKFGLVSAVIDKITDYTIGPNIYIDSDDKNVINILEEWIEQTHFNSYLRPWFKEGLYKGSSYLEIAG